VKETSAKKNQKRRERRKKAQIRAFSSFRRITLEARFPSPKAAEEWEN
jgi:hypothetical protein